MLGVGQVRAVVYCVRGRSGKGGRGCVSCKSGKGERGLF